MTLPNPILKRHLPDLLARFHNLPVFHEYYPEAKQFFYEQAERRGLNSHKRPVVALVYNRYDGPAAYSPESNRIQINFKADIPSELSALPCWPLFCLFHELTHWMQHDVWRTLRFERTTNSMSSDSIRVWFKEQAFEIPNTDDDSGIDLYWQLPHEAEANNAALKLLYEFNKLNGRATKAPLGR